MTRQSEIPRLALAKIARGLYDPAEKDKPNGPSSY
jgi:hypothetical protein